MRAHIRIRSLTVFSRIQLILLRRQQKTVDSSRRGFQQAWILVVVDSSRRGLQQTWILVDVDSSRRGFQQTWILVDVRVYPSSVLPRRSCYNQASPVIEEGLKLGDVEISPKPLVRWLGVFLDSKLTFKQHIEIQISKAKTAFYLIRRLGNTQRGLSLQALRQLYIACVTTIADYGV